MQIAGREHCNRERQRTDGSLQMAKRTGVVRLAPVTAEGRRWMPGVSVVVPCLNEKATIEGGGEDLDHSVFVISDDR